MRPDAYTQTIVQALANWSGLLGAVAWKSIVILAFVAATMLLWRRGAAATRHLVWTAALLCVLCLPLFVWSVPGWRAPAWIVPSGLSSSVPTSLELILTNPTHPETEVASETRRPTAASPTSASTAATATQQAGHALTKWRGGLVALWFIGVGVGLARLLAALIQLRRLAGGTRPCKNAAWLEVVDELRTEYGIRRPVRLLVFVASITPMTWGFWRAVVALPAESVQWPDERLRLVLRHELAHVKRWDCLTQGIAHVARVLYWFNPLAWLAARRMRSEREKACDDFVLKAGARPSEYAGHLVEIARQFAIAPRVGAVAIAHTSGLEQRIRAVLDVHRNRNGLAIVTATLVMVLIVSVGLLVGGVRLEAADERAPEPWSLDKSKVSGQLKAFVAEKEAQANAAAKAEGKTVPSEFKTLFAAAAKGDSQTVTNFFNDMHKLHPQYGGHDQSLRGPAWQPTLETSGAFEQFVAGGDKYAIAFGEDIIKSIPRGSVYFGGTDPGRFLVTALSKSHVNADPFFTLTQNALADNSYVSYLRSMYGQRIKIPTDQDLQRCFQEYVEDVRRREQENKLKTDEHATVTPDGRFNVTGVGAVMEINGRMVKLIFDRNPDREFYIEESYVLDWMYPYLEPHGLILKLNREPLTRLDPAVVAHDREFWNGLTKELLADPRFLGNRWARQMYAHQRSAIGGVYAYRKLTDEAGAVFKQALALCPDSPEANFRLAQLYADQNRFDDAIALLQSFQQRNPSNQKVADTIIRQLENEKQSPRAPTLSEPQKPVDEGQAAMPTNPQSAALQSVAYVQGPRFFREGDSIAITDLLASSAEFKLGDTVKVTGRYTLSSKPKARLCLFVTATGKSGGLAPTVPEQEMQVSRGSGEFVLSETIREEGRLHLSFYDPDTGNPFGGFYFGTEQQMREIADWNVKDWYLKE